MGLLSKVMGVLLKFRGNPMYLPEKLNGNIIIGQ